MICAWPRRCALAGNGQHSTQRDHRPAHHRFRDDWTPDKICSRAARVGPHVAAFAEVVMRKRKHPEQSYRTCFGVIRLPIFRGIRRQVWRGPP